MTQTITFTPARILAGPNKGKALEGRWKAKADKFTYRLTSTAGLPGANNYRLDRTQKWGRGYRTVSEWFQTIAEAQEWLGAEIVVEAIDE